MSIEFLAAGRIEALARQRGTLIAYRRIERVAGPEPSPHPPVMVQPTVKTAAAVGATTLAVTALTLSGRFLAGDKVSIAGHAAPYVVQGSATASGNQASLTLQSPLTAAAAVGAALSFVWTTDLMVPAVIAGVRRSGGEGASVEQSGLSVTLPAAPFTFRPRIHDVLLVGADAYAISQVVPQYVRGQVVSYLLTARL